ncbi:hypothetical protein EVAR_103929_1 [Eumeta japonica]|uniref:Uncharacterized protein n=1 Tax=Eumeta variegata TaxID=151549 RepID=A0A4C1T483_EUMVA|nr:hypothetical protein EVAR_103929_1 [Eumeta japonica]
MFHKLDFKSFKYRLEQSLFDSAPPTPRAWWRVRSPPGKCSAPKVTTAVTDVSFATAPRAAAQAARAPSNN